MTSSVERAWGAVKVNDIRLLKEIVPREISANSCLPDESNDLRYLMHAAAAFGSLDCLKYLIEQGGDIKITTPTGFGVSHWAAYSGWDLILSYLSTLNVSIQEADSNGQTPLHIASARGHFSVVKFLVDNNVNFDRTAEFRWTPLHFAVAYGHERIAKFLIEKGASTSLTDSLGRSAEVLAREYNRNWWNSISKSQ